MTSRQRYGAAYRESERLYREKIAHRNAAGAAPASEPAAAPSELLASQPAPACEPTGLVGEAPGSTVHPMDPGNCPVAQLPQPPAAGPTPEP